jgi:hypothetical protein
MNSIDKKSNACTPMTQTTERNPNTFSNKTRKIILPKNNFSFIE